MDVEGYPDVGQFAQEARLRCEVTAATEPDAEVARDLKIAGLALEIVQMEAWQFDHWPIRGGDDSASLDALGTTSVTDESMDDPDFAADLAEQLRAIRKEAERLQVIELDPVRIELLGGLCLHLATAEESVFRAATWRFLMGRGKMPSDVDSIGQDTLNGYVFPDGAPQWFLDQLEELAWRPEESD